VPINRSKRKEGIRITRTGGFKTGGEKKEGEVEKRVE
jgi:hypothetical protein